MMDGFKVGDRVWDTEKGEMGVIYSITDSDYPVNVSFGDGDDTYTIDGRVSLLGEIVLEKIGSQDDLFKKSPDNGNRSIRN